MNRLSQSFLTLEERERVTLAVHQSELVTSGEIVPMVVSSSSHYPSASFVGGFLTAFLLSIILAPLIGKAFWIGSNNMLLFIALFLFLFFVFYQLVKNIPAAKRLFLLQKEIDHEVEEYALASFFREQLYKTKDETGVLIFISVFERKIVILGDNGINSKITPDDWQDVVTGITTGIRENRQCEAICDAIGQVGGLLKTHFPIKEDDENELHDLIIM